MVGRRPFPFGRRRGIANLVSEKVNDAQLYAVLYLKLAEIVEKAK